MASVCSRSRSAKSALREDTRPEHRWVEPRFIIVQDYKENLRKCTALPLRGFPGIEIFRLPRPAPTGKPLEVPGGILLDVDAPVLSAGDFRLVAHGGGVLVLDASWARLGSLRRRIRARAGETLHRRSLPRILRTAYPRRSKLRSDPERGLATVEAVFATTLIMGRPRPELLVDYRWRDEFLALNDEAFRSFREDTASR